MDAMPLILAYTAAALVALAVMGGFSDSIDKMLLRLLPPEAAPHWARFIKFALAVAAFVGGVPTPAGRFIDRAAPPPPPPGAGEGVMMVMGSVGGALMAAAWILLAFFAATLTAAAAGRAYVALRKHREAEALLLAQRDEERKAEKTRQDRSESHGEPVKRKEPSEPRPVAREKHAPPPQRR